MQLKPRILIVDDESLVRDLLSQVLSEKYDCMTANSSEEALFLIQKEEFNLILSDILMGGMSGIEMIPHVFESLPDAVILIISGNQTIDTAIEAIRGGAFDYIKKPFDLDYVTMAVDRALKHHLLLTEMHRISGIDINKYFRSQENLPAEFPQKANLLTEDTKSLIYSSTEFYSCFISYTERDDAFSKRLYEDLKSAGVRCWRWKEDAKWGNTLRKSIYESVLLYDKLIVILSEDSLQAPAVIEEMERALNKEDAQSKDGVVSEVLFPIRVDDSILEWKHYLKDRVMRKYVGDFRDWNLDSRQYQKSFAKLVRDLDKS